MDGDVVVRLEENPVTTAGAVARAKATAVPASETLPWLISAVLVGLALYFFIGIDQGAVSVFGDTSYIHELSTTPATSSASPATSPARSTPSRGRRGSYGGTRVRAPWRGGRCRAPGSSPGCSHSCSPSRRSTPGHRPTEEGRGEAEQALAIAAGAAPAGGGEEEIVSRGVQATLGVGIGMVGIGIAVGLLFAVAYTFLHGRVALRPRVLALLVAGAGFLTIYATPFVKYPASPPAVGSDETIGDRTALYLVMVVGSLVFMAVAVAVTRQLGSGSGRGTRCSSAVCVRRARGDPHVGAAGSRRADDQRRRERPAGQRDAAAAA